ncbi:MAG: hypothetical protein ACE5FN_07660 [Leptospirillia bacterium]
MSGMGLSQVGGGCGAVTPEQLSALRQERDNLQNIALERVNAGVGGIDNPGPAERTQPPEHTPEASLENRIRENVGEAAGQVIDQDGNIDFSRLHELARERAATPSENVSPAGGPAPTGGVAAYQAAAARPASFGPLINTIA